MSVRRISSIYLGVRLRPVSNFYTEICAAGYDHTHGTFVTAPQHELP
jgi:hypothetical protein